MAVSKAVKNAAGKAVKAAKGVPGIGAAALDVGGNVIANMLSGNSFGTSLLKGIPEAAAYAIAPVPMFALALSGLPKAAVQGYMAADQRLASNYNMRRQPGTMFSYQDTNQAVTMRQAAVQAIQGSKLNARNALGGEASLMHRNWADRM